MRYSITITLAVLICVSCGSEQKSNTTGWDYDASPESEMPAPIMPDHDLNVAFLVLDQVYNTELTAPYDIFQHSVFRKGVHPMRVFTVGRTKDTVRTFEGLKILPDYGYTTDSLPAIDILVIPSAAGNLDVDLEDTVLLAWVRTISENAMFVTSHCDGAFVLAESGVLDGVNATTFPGDIAEFRQRYPQIHVHDSTLFVHDDKFITSAGGAKSFEAALYLFELLYGKENAEDCAEGMVIDWDVTKVDYVRIVPL